MSPPTISQSSALLVQLVSVLLLYVPFSLLVPIPHNLPPVFPLQSAFLHQILVSSHLPLQSQDFWPTNSIFFWFPSCITVLIFSSPPACTLLATLHLAALRLSSPTSLYCFPSYSFSLPCSGFCSFCLHSTESATPAHRKTNFSCEKPSFQKQSSFWIRTEYQACNNADQTEVLQEHISETSMPLFPKQKSTQAAWSRAGDKDLLVMLEEFSQFYQWWETRKLQREKWVLAIIYHEFWSLQHHVNLRGVSLGTGASSSPGRLEVELVAFCKTRGQSNLQGSSLSGYEWGDSMGVMGGREIGRFLVDVSQNLLESPLSSPANPWKLNCFCKAF